MENRPEGNWRPGPVPGSWTREIPNNTPNPSENSFFKEVKRQSPTLARVIESLQATTQRKT